MCTEFRFAQNWTVPDPTECKYRVKPGSVGMCYTEFRVQRPVFLSTPPYTPSFLPLQIYHKSPEGRGIFRWHNPSGRTMVLVSTQPLTEMSTRDITWREEGGRCVGLNIFFFTVDRIMLCKACSVDTDTFSPHVQTAQYNHELVTTYMQACCKILQIL
jgi:hypothetical protein